MPLSNPHSPARRWAAIAVTIAILVFTAVAGRAFFKRIAAKPLSEDAVLTADLARMAPGAPGRLDVVAVQENSKVSRGDLLFKVDPEFYQLQVEQARALLRAAEAGQDSRGRSVQAESSNATIATEQIARARANVALTTQTWQRLNALAPKGYVTAQQVDEALTLKRNAETSLKEATAQQSAARALVGNQEAAAALVAERRAALAIAERQLRETEVRAPNDGRVAGLTASQGDYVIPGQSLLTLINTTRWYASAGFLETELEALKPGDCATVYVAADRSRALPGVVESIAWGVSSEELINLPRRLPYVPKSLNWVRVGQRFPVRVLLKDPPEELMRAGASATVMIDHDQRC